MKTWALVLAFAGVCGAQERQRLTLDEAEALAVRNHPSLAAAALNAQAVATQEKQVRAGLRPLMTGNLTTVGADSGTSIAAGQLQTSGLASRAATGVGFSQLITDFGRTNTLADSARLRASAQDKNVGLIRAQVTLRVDQMYYAVLASEAVLKVAEARLNAQKLTLRQVQALAASQLRSTLDVSFAEVAVSEAELALYEAENASKARRAQLSAAIGSEVDADYELADVSLPGPLTTTAASSVEEALRNRPELAVARFTQSAAERFAVAEQKLKYPTFSAVAAVGLVPLHQNNFVDQYSGVGLNVTLPFLNGGLFAARQAEAELRAKSSAKDVQSLALEVSAGARVAWIEANNSWRRLDVTAKLVDQATRALRLANARYDIGLSGIIELTQAQLSQTSAQIAAANAKYDYLTRIATLNYAIGAYR